jgi:hypothetical protein
VELLSQRTADSTVAYVFEKKNCTVESLKAALQRRGGMEALCSLAIIEDAHKANKMTGLSGDEQLLFVAIKATKVFHIPYTKNPHKSLFTLLTGRSATW